MEMRRRIIVATRGTQVGAPLSITKKRQTSSARSNSFALLIPVVIRFEDADLQRLALNEGSLDRRFVCYETPASDKLSSLFS